MDLVLDFTHSYPREWIEKYPDMQYIDCSDIEGTDMYCSPEAEAELGRRLSPYPVKGIHFMDSGNYHYLTRIFTKRIQEPYNLLFFDNHTDCKPSMIPELLSCGAWAKKVLEEDPHLNKMILIGPKRADMDEVQAEYADKLVCISREELMELQDGMNGKNAKEESPKGLLWRKLAGGGLRHPLYISIDKDVMSEEYARTNWDQGKMSLPLLLFLLCAIKDKCSENKIGILGIDICGELPPKDIPAGEEATVRKINIHANDELYRFCGGIL